MTTLPITPLDPWHRAKLNLAPGKVLTRQQLDDYQLKQLNATLARAVRFSPFYRNRRGTKPSYRVKDFKEFESLPFTTPEDLRRSPMQFLAVSQSEVARVVTLHTSGTTGDPKRIYFSDSDLEHTIDFFHHGLAAMARPGQRLLILLPGQTPQSAANLLKAAAARMDVTAIIHGLVTDPAQTIETILKEKINCLAGIPVQVLSLVRHEHSSRIPPDLIHSVLLSTDYVPQATAKCIQKALNTNVFQHYGMTEMGFGGAMSCAANQGYHLREADLYFEIIDPVTQKPLPMGEIGEVVFTTLTQQAMPLIRYRTGDMAAMLPSVCPCGSQLKRMTWVQGRLKKAIRLTDGSTLTLKDLDEALFPLPGILNFKVALKTGHLTDYLELTLFVDRTEDKLPAKATEALKQITPIAAALNAGALTITPVRMKSGMGSVDMVVKRTILDLRENITSLS